MNLLDMLLLQPAPKKNQPLFVGPSKAPSFENILHSILQEEPSNEPSLRMSPTKVSLHTPLSINSSKPTSLPHTPVLDERELKRAPKQKSPHPLPNTKSFVPPSFHMEGEKKKILQEGVEKSGVAQSAFPLKKRFANIKDVKRSEELPKTLTHTQGDELKPDLRSTHPVQKRGATHQKEGNKNGVVVDMSNHAPTPKAFISSNRPVATENRSLVSTSIHSKRAHKTPYTQPVVEKVTGKEKRNVALSPTVPHIAMKDEKTFGVETLQGMQTQTQKEMNLLPRTTSTKAQKIGETAIKKDEALARSEKERFTAHSTPQPTEKRAKGVEERNVTKETSFLSQQLSEKVKEESESIQRGSEAIETARPALQPKEPKILRHEMPLPKEHQTVEQRALNKQQTGSGRMQEVSVELPRFQAETIHFQRPKMSPSNQKKVAKMAVHKEAPKVTTTVAKEDEPKRELESHTLSEVVSYVEPKRVTVMQRSLMNEEGGFQKELPDESWKKEDGEVSIESEFVGMSREFATQQQLKAKEVHFLKLDDTRVHIRVHNSQLLIDFFSNTSLMVDGAQEYVEHVMQEHGFEEYRIRLKDKKRDLLVESAKSSPSQEVRSMIDVKV